MELLVIGLHRISLTKVYLESPIQIFNIQILSDYLERVLEFAELKGAYSGENIAHAVYNLLSELHLESKLITITADNASNNKAMVSILETLLSESNSQFHGINSFIRCLAHILNLIVKEILRSLKSGTYKEAVKICNHLHDENLSTESALSRLRILAVWIHRSPQRSDAWTNVCTLMKLSDRVIPYDVDIRWNSTFEMIDIALQAKAQINRYLEYQSDIPCFTEQDWYRLSQIHRVLIRFNSLTNFVSVKYPQISMTIPLYYELYDFLHQGANREEIFADLDDDIATAIRQGLIKYQKYYTFMDNTDTYYTALILDPRVKGDLLLKELDTEVGQMIIDTIRKDIHTKYLGKTRQSSPDSVIVSDNYSDPETRMLQRLAPVIRKPAGSDVDDYFTTSRIAFHTAGDPTWLAKWWYTHCEDMP